MSIDYNPLQGTFDIVSSSGGGSGANQGLSNLTNPTSINQDLIPDGNATRALGSSVDVWQEVFTPTVHSLTDMTITTDVSPATASITVVTNTDGAANINSGAVSIKTGDSNSDNNAGLVTTGNIQLTTGGDVGGFSQPIDTGSISLITGSGAGTRGNVSVDSKDLNLFDRMIFDPATLVVEGAGTQCAALIIDNAVLNGVFAIGSKSAVADGEATAKVGIYTGFQSSPTGTSDTGTIDIITGVNAGSGVTGNVNIFSGDASSTSGNLDLRTGDANDSGNILLTTGTGAGSRGQIVLSGTGMQLVTNDVEPVASVTYRGTFRFTQNGAGVADVLKICIKDASDTYVWKIITLT